MTIIKDYFYAIRNNIKSLFYYVFFEWRDFNIKHDEIVADFGSGGHPLLRADILIDKFLSGATERPTDFVDTGSFIIQSDLSFLPFKNKVVDFSYSSHTIEHLEDIEKSLAEMERVSKRGYITCPSAFRESIVAHKMHLWFIEKKENQLLITEKTNPYPEFINNFFDKLLASRKSYIWFEFEKNFKNRMYINYYWNGKINFTIKKTADREKWKIEGETEYKDSANVLLSLRKKIIIFAAKLIKLCFARTKIKIEEILCCPFCKSSLDFYDEFVFCKKCDRKFKHKDKRIFYFLKSSSVKV